MRRLAPLLCLGTSLFIGLLAASQPARASEYDYFSANRNVVRNGVQAVLMCNGLFTSERPLAAVFEQELAYLTDPVGSPRGGEYTIDETRRFVAVGGPSSGPVVHAAFREGVGCVVMAPDQSPEDIDALPSIAAPAKTYDPADTPWPMGDVVESTALPDHVDAAKLQQASDWAFNRPTEEQDTISLIVVHRGQIVHERYAPGFDRTTRTRTWSTAKSMAATLIGMLVEQGDLELDGSLGLDWLPETGDQDEDPRDAITLRDVLQMSSGLYPVDSFGMEYATGSGLAYWAGASSHVGARQRGLIREPGTHWDYENYDTLLAVAAMKRVLGERYHTYPGEALLSPLGMHSTLLSTDRFGDFILSSQVYTNARDLARFGLLYAQGGVWQGEQLVSKEWIEFVTTPAPSTVSRGHIYGGQFWLVPDDRDDVPSDAYSTAGNRGQYVVIVPSHDLVIVRRGLDYGRQGFDLWSLAREVLKAFPEP